MQYQFEWQIWILDSFVLPPYAERDAKIKMHHVSTKSIQGNLTMVEDNQQPDPMKVDSDTVETHPTAENDGKVDKITALQDAIDG
jgi:hypothetical protein